MKRPLDILLDEMLESAAMPSLASLCCLSNLEAKEAARTREAWPNLSVELRRQLVTKLVKVAEADFEMDFSELFRLGMGDEDAQVRTAAIKGLWEDGDVRLVPLLAARLREDKDATVRAAAATSLGRFVLMGELEEIRPDPHALAYETLLAACQDTEEQKTVRRRALESLAYTDKEIVTDLIREAYAASEEKMRISAVFAMGRSADNRWSRQVQQELFSPNPELRYEAARACGELRLSKTVPELGELAEDADPEVQEAALWALGQIGGDKAAEILKHHCMAEDEATQAAARVALDELEFLHGDLSEFLDRLIEEPANE